MNKRIVLAAVGISALLFLFQQCAPFEAGESQNTALQSGEPNPTPPPTDDEIAAGQQALSQLFNGAAADRLYGVMPSRELGYITYGMTRSYGGGTEPNAVVIKNNALGITQWAVHAGVTAGNDQFFDGIELPSDGAVILAGLSRVNPPGPADQALVVKLSSAGAWLWGTRIGSPLFEEVVFSVAAAEANMIVVAGRRTAVSNANADGFVAKINVTSGAVVWQRSMGGAGNEYFKAVRSMANGDLLLIGRTASFGAGLDDGWLVRMDPAGNVIWSRAFGGAAADNFEDARELPGGGIVALGSTGSFGAGLTDVLISFFDGAGAHVRSLTAGGVRDDQGGSIVRLADGNLLVAGSQRSFGNADQMYDGFVMKIAADASAVRWSRVYGSAGDDRITRAVELADRRLAYSSFSSLDGTAPVERSAFGAMKANGELGFTCMPASAQALALTAIPTPVITPVSVTPVAVTNTPEVLAATFLTSIATPAINACTP